MANKIDIRDLYRIRRTVFIDDGRGNNAEVILQTVSQAAKEKAIEMATEKKAKIQAKFEDVNSDVSIVLNSSFKEATIDSLVDDIVALDFSILLEVEDKLSKKEIDKNSENYQEEYNKIFKQESEKVKKNILKLSDKEIIEKAKKIRGNFMAESYFLKAFNEVILFNAIRGESGDKLFSSLEEMNDNLYGNTFNQLVEEYYKLDNKKADEIKN